MITLPTPKKDVNLKKISMEELLEIEDRETTLLNKNSIIQRLPDKGASIKVFLEKVTDEIKYRKDIADLEDTFSKIKVNDEDLTNSKVLKDTYIQHVCEKEKIVTKERYKPSSSLVHPFVKTSTKPSFSVDTNHSNKPTKLIALPESLVLQTLQAKRVQQEQIKVRTHNQIKRDLSDQSDSDTDHDSDCKSSSSEEKG